MLLQDAISDYISYITHEMGVTKSTLHGYKSYLKAYVRFVDGTEADVNTTLTAENLRKFLYHKSGEGLRPRSIRGIFYPLRGLSKFLLANKAIDADPMAGITMPKLDAPIRHTVSDQECGLLLAACGRVRDKRRGAMARGILSCLIYCGLRASELLDLKISDVSMDRATITVVHGKYKKNRTLYPIDDTLNAVRDWLLVRSSPTKVIDTDYLWAYDKKRRLAYNGLSALIDEIKHIAGLADRDNIHPHALRRGFATRLMAAGATIKTIQSALGHSEPTTTFAYLADANEPARAMKDLAKLTSSSGDLLPTPTTPVDQTKIPPKPTRADHLSRQRRRLGVR